MPFEKGKPRPKAAGRKKGTPNRKTELLMEKCERLGLDPFEALIKIAMEEPEVETQLTALKEICQYLYPKRKAIEHSGELSNPFLNKSIDELEVLVKEKMK